MTEYDTSFGAAVSVTRDVPIADVLIAQFIIHQFNVCKSAKLQVASFCPSVTLVLASFRNEARSIGKQTWRDSEVCFNSKKIEDIQDDGHRWRPYRYCC